MSDRFNPGLLGLSQPLQHIQKQPPFCECAYIASRNLRNGSMPGFVKNLTAHNSYLDKKNLRLEHEQIFFPMSGDNIGFGPDGLFSEDMENKGYVIRDNTCYNGQAMRQAIAGQGDQSSYGLFSNNCQDYVSRIRGIYSDLISSFKNYCSSFN